MGEFFSREWLLRVFALALQKKIQGWNGDRRGKHYRTRGAGAAHGQHRPGGSRYARAVGIGSYELSPQQIINAERRKRVVELI